MRNTSKLTKYRYECVCTRNQDLPVLFAFNSDKAVCSRDPKTSNSILILIVIVNIMIQKWNLYFYFRYDDHIYRPRIKEKKCIAVFTCAYRRHAVPSKYSWSNIKKCIAIFRLQRKSVSQKSESASQFANCDTLIRGLLDLRVERVESATQLSCVVLLVV